MAPVMMALPLHGQPGDLEKKAHLEGGFYISKAGDSFYLCLVSIQHDRDTFLVRTLKYNSKIPGVGQGEKKNSHDPQ